MRYEDVVTAIASGELDDDLDRVQETLRARYGIVRQQKAALMSATLQQGQRVRFSQQISPQYLRGLEAEIVEPPRPGESLKVKPVHPELAGRFGRGVTTVPADLVEAI